LPRPAEPPSVRDRRDTGGVEAPEPHALASQLHDGPIQELTVARLHIDLIRRKHHDDAGLLTDLEVVERSVAKAAEGLAAMIAELHASRRS
jgi:signal transduction histidine kinase